MADEMKIFQKAGERVAAELGDGPPGDRLAAQKRAFMTHLATSGQTRQARPLLVFATVSAVAAALALVVVGSLFAIQGEEKPLPFWVGEVEKAGSAGTWVHADEEVPVPIRFDNGSRMALEAMSAARVVESTQENVDVNLSSGKLNADIKGNGETSWTVNAGPYKVTVLGTEFIVDWNTSTSTLGVSVTRGKVLVRGGHLNEYGIRLTAGKRLVANGLDGSVAVESIHAEGDRENELVMVDESAEDQPGEAANENPVVEPSGEASEGSSSRASRPAELVVDREVQWKKLCEGKDYTGAVDAAEAEGLEKLVSSLEREDLWKLGSAARYARRPEVSKKVYLAVRDRFAGSGRASTAAFMLGRIALDDRNDPVRAHRWFSTYLDEAPSGPLVEEALGRLIDACDKAGRGDEAAQRARQYLSVYGEGLFAKLAKSILQK